ncbi:MAG: hypothetical protein J7L99_02000 [Planctomycetes bacterium]|nr:hypothetical protein [Planctomycetota bacterium]
MAVIRLPIWEKTLSLWRRALGKIDKCSSPFAHPIGRVNRWMKKSSRKFKR